MPSSAVVRHSLDPVTVPARGVMRSLRAAIGWLSAGYSADASHLGHCSLIALHGPVALSDNQVQHAVAAIESTSRDDVDIATAITRETDALPTRGQVQQIRRALSPST